MFARGNDSAKKSFFSEGSPTLDCDPAESVGPGTHSRSCRTAPGRAGGELAPYGAGHAQCPGVGEGFRQASGAGAIMLAAHQVQVQQPPGMSLLRKYRTREARTAPVTVCFPCLLPAVCVTLNRKTNGCSCAHTQAHVITDPLRKRYGLDALLHGTTTIRIGPGLAGQPRQVMIDKTSAPTYTRLRPGNLRAGLGYDEDSVTLSRHELARPPSCPALRAGPDEGLTIESPQKGLDLGLAGSIRKGETPDGCVFGLFIL